jgi:hypothetical protein
MIFTEAADLLAAADAELTRRTVRAKSLGVVRGYLKAGTLAYGLGDATNLQIICRALGAPHKYLGELPDHLRDTLLQYHLDQGAVGRDTIDVIARHNHELVALDRSDLSPPLPAADVLAAVVAAIGQHELQFKLDVQKLGTVRFTVLALDRNVEVRPKDVIHAGLQVRHSMLGDFATDINCYVERLRCVNGAVSRTCIDQRQAPRTRRVAAGHPEAAKVQKEQVQRLARSAWQKLTGKLTAIAELPKIRYASPLQIEGQFRSIAQQNRLSAKHKRQGESIVDRLLRAWRKEGEELSAFGLTNAITSVATHDPTLTERERFILSRLGGLLTFQGHHMCPRCFSLIGRELPRDASRVAAVDALPSHN